MATVDRDGVVTGRPGGGARAPWTWCSRFRAWPQRGEMLLHNHPSGRLDPSVADLNVAARLHDGGVGLRDHRQRRDRALRRGRGAARPAGRSGSIRSTWSDTLGEGGPVAHELGPVRGPAAASATWRPTSPTATTTAGCSCSRRAPGSGKSFAYLRTGAALGARQRRAHGREHQHDQPAGAAGRQGSAARCGARWRPRTTRRRSRCSRAGGTISASRGCNQAVGVAADAARAGQAGRAASALRSGPATRPTAP